MGNYAVILVVLSCFLRGYVLSSNLQITGLNFSNHTTEMNSTLTAPPTTSTTTVDPKKLDESSRSEIYKMHNNGLMLLHAQRSRSGSEAKKSQLVDNIPASSINYHIRKRGKINETNTVAENEKYLESKLGDLPQVHHKRSIKAFESMEAHDSTNKKRLVEPTKSQYEKRKKRNFANASPVTFISEIKKLCNNKKSKKQNCQHNNNGKKIKWKSLVQGEDANGSSLTKHSIKPEKLNHTEEKIAIELYSNNNNNDNDKSIKINTVKHERLKRAFSAMNFNDNGNPLYDDDQSENIIKSRAHKYHSKHHRRNHILSDRFSRKFAPAIPAIPKISDVLEPLKSFDTKALFSYANGDAFEPIPKIKPLSSDFDSTADRRQLGIPTINDNFRYRSLPPPTEVVPLTDIPPLSDIPIIKPAQRGTFSKTLNGTQRQIILTPNSKL